MALLRLAQSCSLLLLVDLHLTGLPLHLTDGVDRLQLVLMKILSPGEKGARLQRSKLLRLLQLLFFLL